MRDTLRTILVKVAAGSVVETLRFKDEDNYEVDIQLNFFFAYSQNIIHCGNLQCTFFNQKS